LASLVALALALRPDVRPVAPGGQPVAVVERIDGTPRRSAHLKALPEGEGRLSVRDAIHAGEWIATDARTRVAVRFSDGTSVRLDVGSRARPLAPGVIELTAGAVYVDSPGESARFEVRTPVATARDVGTQFEVRLLDGGLRLRVRTGTVELGNGPRSVSARDGTEVTLTTAGAVSRPFAAHGPEWDWTAGISPPFDIEGLSLSVFLDRIAREHGWALQYADSALAREASSTLLHGSVHDLAPREALDVVITTSGLSHRLDDGVLLVLRGAEAR
jgi:ferric-dicitrate binding protein FerR (iron transport regulator)